MEGTEAHGDPPALPGLVELALGVDEPAVGGWRQADEVELPAAREADAIDAEKVHQLADRADWVRLATVADVVGAVILGQSLRLVQLRFDRIDPERRDLLTVYGPATRLLARSTRGWS
jgi:hypothetical protein